MVPQKRYPNVIPGYNRILHGGDYNPDQWLHMPEVIDEDFRLMPLAGCNTFSVGIFAWTAMEPEEGRYTFEWLDRIMDRTAALDNRVILATPSGAKPAWMAHRYPEIRRVNRRGDREIYEGRHNHCWASAIYREKVQAINTRLAERYAGHAALGMWHLSNEYSGECFCPLCLQRWHEWLQRKYQTLDAMNQAWWTGFWSHTYTAWEQVEPRDHVVEGMSLDWMRFITWQMTDFMRWEMVPLRQITPNVPCTTNFMGTFSGLDYSQVARYVDVIADDQYPTYQPDDPAMTRNAIGVSFKDDLYRNFKTGRPFFLMESCPGAVQWKKPQKLKRPGVHRLEMMQAIAHGADGTCYFQWRAGRGGMEKFHGTVVDHNGHEHTRTFQEVAALGKAYQQIPQVLGTSVEPRVAILFDWESRWAQQMSDGVGATHHTYDIVAHDHYEAFWRRGIPVDVIGKDRSLDPYDLVVAPMHWILHPGQSQQWKEYVQNGGTLVATYDTGMSTPTNLIHTGGWPGEGLRDLFGFWVEETDRLGVEGKRQVSVRGRKLHLKPKYEAFDVCALGHLCGATAVATYADDFYKGRPAVTVNKVGKGRAIYLAARFRPDGLLDDLYGSLVKKLKIEPVIDAKLPPNITAQMRGAGRDQYVFLMNFSNTPRTVSLGSRKLQCIETGTKLGRSLALKPLEARVLKRRDA